MNTRSCSTTGLSIPIVAGSRAVIAVSATSSGGETLNQALDLRSAVSLAMSSRAPPKNDESPAGAGLSFEADEETRTLDLLHGKQTL